MSKSSEGTLHIHKYKGLQKTLYVTCNITKTTICITSASHQMGSRPKCSMKPFLAPYCVGVEPYAAERKRFHAHQPHTVTAKDIIMILDL
jgi:hypothetical protein